MTISRITKRAFLTNEIISILFIYTFIYGRKSCRNIKSDQPEKKFKALVDGKTIHFGNSNYQDYTQHKNPMRKDAYISRHRSRENWSKSGIDTAGFYSRFVLWEKPTVKEAVSALNSKYKNIKFKLKS